MREREAERLDEAHGASAGRGEDATPLDVSSDAVGVERGGRRGGGASATAAEDTPVGSKARMAS